MIGGGGIAGAVSPPLQQGLQRDPPKWIALERSPQSEPRPRASAAEQHS